LIDIYIYIYMSIYIYIYIYVAYSVYIYIYMAPLFCFSWTAMGPSRPELMTFGVGYAVWSSIEDGLEGIKDGLGGIKDGLEGINGTHQWFGRHRSTPHRATPMGLTSSPIVLGVVGSPGERWEALGVLGKPWEVLGSIWKRWKALGTAGRPWEAPGSAGKPWGALGGTGRHWKALESRSAPTDPEWSPTRSQEESDEKTKVLDEVSVSESRKSRFGTPM
jgi:hypothetical protein